MVTALLSGMILAASAALVALAYRRAPTRLRCPNCANATQPVQLPAWMTAVKRYLSRRWCAVCSWEGIGRAGPEWVPGKPVAHRSGFRFGEDVTGPNMGFAWRNGPTPPPETPPPLQNRPLGFQFSISGPDLRERRPGTDATGFQFRKPPEPLRPDDPTGFRWAPGPVQGPVFRWGEDQDPDRRKEA